MEKLNYDILYNEETLQTRISQLAKELEKDYKEKKPIFISILKGSIYFFSDLTKKIDIDMEIDFMNVSSYFGKKESSGVVKIIMDLSKDIKDRDIVIIEDIIDTGLTLDYLKKTLELRKPKSIKVCTLLDKKENRKVPFEADYAGFVIPNKFVIGYGLDYEGLYRNLPFIGTVE